MKRAALRLPLLTHLPHLALPRHLGVQPHSIAFEHAQLKHTPALLVLSQIILLQNSQCALVRPSRTLARYIIRVKYELLFVHLGKHLPPTHLGALNQTVRANSRYVLLALEDLHGVCPDCAGGESARIIFRAIWGLIPALRHVSVRAVQLLVLLRTVKLPFNVRSI